VFEKGVITPDVEDNALLKTVVDPVLEMLGEIIPDKARRVQYWPTMQATRYGEVCV
jgi:hypothetical protein